MTVMYSQADEFTPCHVFYVAKAGYTLYDFQLDFAVADLKKKKV